MANKKRKPAYPGTAEAEKQRSKTVVRDEEPDFIGDKPNYEKFEKRGWSTEKTLVWLNID